MKQTYTMSPCVGHEAGAKLSAVHDRPVLRQHPHAAQRGRPRRIERLVVRASGCCPPGRARRPRCCTAAGTRRRASRSRAWRRARHPRALSPAEPAFPTTPRAFDRLADIRRATPRAAKSAREGEPAAPDDLRTIPDKLRKAPDELRLTGDDARSTRGGRLGVAPLDRRRRPLDVAGASASSPNDLAERAALVGPVGPHCALLERRGRLGAGGPPSAGAGRPRDGAARGKRRLRRRARPSARLGFAPRRPPRPSHARAARPGPRIVHDDVDAQKPEQGHEDEERPDGEDGLRGPRDWTRPAPSPRRGSA